LDNNLGKGLAIIIDFLNPEPLIIGSIYGRQKAIREPIVKEEIQREVLIDSRNVCQIVPAGLGESVGELTSLSVALNALDMEHSK